ncbi:hypothetical protein [Curtobacterium aurantiacum]|uniref:Ig-like domain-containing protein n=1 Tax=Curtobacterium aurantiacum TaxID=3236919 RepID=A0ABS5VEB3_9MICO|nr:hypothetical protein [Curtobacterium flaccumfaciens]MBT1544443.1 hypothetical protein [Curtobacterium flaccumfaciens pv. flaccumfaciens]MBT1587271.1 hypothetical protein [Curtobacterium flaccumfaciens pv. flaccumfaciens]MBT1674909.1 hypothetical protein [Curtobacterium flaccumfaciens pv. flaccumfaciens]MBT1680721.1 hypothetical protein [Curtobacterium flaccumfaciens pv. flaccumfaciens]
MNRRLRLLVAALLTAVLVGGTSSAAWAVWSSASTTAASTTIGKVAASISGTSALTTAFSASVTSTTKPITLTDSGTLGGSATTTVSVVSGSSAALAKAVTVVAWPVTSAAACTTSTAVGSGSVTGSWASLPSMTAKLAAGASAVWCTRSTLQSSAPAGSTAKVNVNLTVTSGTWTSGVVTGGFTLTTPAATVDATPSLVCTDHGGWYVEVRWDAANRPMDTWYGAYVGSTPVGHKAQDYSAFITIAPPDIPTSAGTAGTLTVTVKVLDSAGNPTTTVAGTGKVTLFTQDNGAAIRCGV